MVFNMLSPENGMNKIIVCHLPPKYLWVRGVSITYPGGKKGVTNCQDDGPDKKPDEPGKHHSPESADQDDEHWGIDTTSHQNRFEDAVTAADD